jgi:predicted component of type VI protein secretion system
MDNYQSNNVIMQLENIAQLLKTQNELLTKLLQPQEDEKTQRRKALQELLRNAEADKNTRG